MRRGNVYQYLCKPLGHDAVIDVRAEVDGIGRACLLVWHIKGRRFTQDDVRTLLPLPDLLSEAISGQRDDVRWVPCSSGNAHLITDMTGELLLAIDPEAEALLMHSHLLAQNVGMLSRPRTGPAFALIMAGMLEVGAPARHEIPVANGRIVATARPTHMLDGEGGEITNMFVALRHEVSLDVLCIEHLTRLPLSPLQTELALFGMLGGERTACGERFGVSSEALKKHNARILDILDLGRWLDLPHLAEKLAQAARPEG